MTALPGSTEIYSVGQIIEGQAGNDVRYNESLEILAILANKVLVNRGYRDTDDITEAEGQMYYIDGSGLNDWVGEDDKLAIYVNGQWTFHPLPEHDCFLVLADGATTAGYPKLEKVDNTGGSPSWSDA